MTEHQRVRLGSGALTPGSGDFLILAISAGEGNGWHFGAAVLQESLRLWDGTACFIDHAREQRSVRDLAGLCHAPAWDAARQGICLRLRPAGPGAGLLTELGRQTLAQGSAAVGFSADLLFHAEGREVRQICQVFSVDLVFQPARGGRFLSGPEQITNEGEEPMSDTEPTSAAAPAPDLCGWMLETALAAERLPEPLAGQVRARFAGRSFEPAELTRSLAEARGLLSQLTGQGVVQGPRLSGMFDTRDQLQAATDDLFGAPRDPALAGLKTQRLSGIRELYLTLTGDEHFHGGYHPERARLATTADFSGLVKNALNKLVANTWDELGRAGYDWWRAVTTVEHFGSLNEITGTLVGTVGDLPEVAEGAAYTELAVGDSPETAAFKKYGGYIPLTLELIDRDETRRLRQYARELASAGLRKISGLVAAIFSQNGGLGPTMADGGTLFNTAAVTTISGHANLRSAALDAAEWDAVCAAVYQQPMLVKNAAGHYGSGPRLAVNPRVLLVPRPLQRAARQILLGDWAVESDKFYDNLLKGSGVPVVVPEWTDANNWAAVCDPQVAPAVFIGERFGLLPEIYIAGDELSPAVFSNDEHRLKVRHFMAVWVNDWRPLHKNNVA
ncbi:MAG TPA: hypothetical protein PKW33_20085 [Anaerolineaceae bacterium]|nr:hypothetical protein [Anaerolineaceae bacterium]HPN53906.1 hypothetical protein [Anaerolineaceae bacterium]